MTPPEPYYNENEKEHAINYLMYAIISVCPHKITNAFNIVHNSELSNKRKLIALIDILQQEVQL
jgi:hypothetical protein